MIRNVHVLYILALLYTYTCTCTYHRLHCVKCLKNRLHVHVHVVYAVHVHVLKATYSIRGLTNISRIVSSPCWRLSPCRSLNPFCPLLLSSNENTNGSSWMLFIISWNSTLHDCSWSSPADTRSSCESSANNFSIFHHCDNKIKHTPYCNYT